MWQLSKFFTQSYYNFFATLLLRQNGLKLTPEPFRRDVLQQSEGYAEESDEQVADSQRADKNICGRLNGPFLHDDVDNQTVSRQSHEEDHHVRDEEDRLGAVGQLGDVDERLDVVSVDELLAAQVVVAEHLLQLFSSYPAGLLVWLRRRCCHPGAGDQARKSCQSLGQVSSEPHVRLDGALLPTPGCTRSLSFSPSRSLPLCACM